MRNFSKTVKNSLYISMALLATNVTVLAKEESTNMSATITNTHVAINLNDENQVNYFVKQGETVKILEDLGDMFTVELDDGFIVNIEKDNLEVIIEEVVKETVTQSNSSYGEDLVSFAKKYLGTRYAYGGVSLTSGVDCSGFVSQVYKNFANITLQRSSSSQYASDGQYITKSQLQAFFVSFSMCSGKLGRAFQPK